MGEGPGSDGPAGGLWESVKFAAPPARSPRSWAMENGAVYSPTTEENPGPARGARSSLAAYFSLGRLRLHRRLFKVLQLVSPRPEWASLAGAGDGLTPGPPARGACEAAELLLLNLVVQEGAVSTPPFPSLSDGKRGGVLPPAAGRPLSPGFSPTGSPMTT